MFKSLTHHEFSRQQWILVCILGFIAFTSINILLFPFESPISTAAPSDIGIFLTIGKGIEQGLVPYRDLFASIGYFFTPDSKIGPFIVTNLWFYLNLLVLLHYIKHRNVALLTFIGLWFFAWLFGPSLMFTESYALVFNTTAFCITYRYLSEPHEAPLKPLQVILLALCLSFSALTKVTNCIGCISCIVTLFFVYIHYHWYKPLFKSIFIFIIVALIPFALFTIYFMINDALMLFLDGYILDSLRYSIINGNTNAFTDLITSIKYGLAFIIPLWIWLFENQTISIDCRFFILISYIFCYIGQNIGGPVPHYLIAFTPLYALIDASVLIGLTKGNPSIFKKFVLIGITMLIMIVPFIKCLLEVGWNTLTYRLYASMFVDASTQMNDQINHYTDKTLFGYNIEPTFYLVSDHLPATPYFVLQEQQSTFIPRIQPYLQDQFKNESIDLVVVSSTQPFTDHHTAQAFFDHYHYVGEAQGTNYKNDHYTLYLYQANHLQGE